MDLFYTYINEFSGKNKKEKQHNAGRFIVEYAAKFIYKIENSEIEIINKKPKFKYSDINFSISHSNNIAAVCFDKYPLGFDIEFMKQRDYKSIAQRMHFKTEENTLKEFYKNWTLYEAEVKLQNKLTSYKSELFLDNYIYTITSSERSDIVVKMYQLPFCAG